MAFKRFLVSGLLSVAGLCFLLLASSNASAATLNVVGGQLVGAWNVDVGGQLGIENLSRIFRTTDTRHSDK